MVYLLYNNRLGLTLKLQNKNNELTEILEQIYFSLLSDSSPDLDEVYKNFGNLATHYSIYDIDRVRYMPHQCRIVTFFIFLEQGIV